MTEEVAELPGEELPEETGEAVENEDSATSTPEDTSEAPKKGVAKRIDELVGQRNQEREEKEWFRKQYEQMQQRLDALQQKPEPEAPQVSDTPPDINQFESYDKYLEALADYKAEQKFKEWENRQQEQSKQTEAQQRQNEFNARISQFSTEHPDFEMKTSTVPWNEGVYEVVSTSEDGPRLLYHLGSNPELAARITSLPPVQAAMELGKIEATLSRPARNQTSAPEPVEPLSGSGQAKSTDPSKMSAEEWRDMRNRQEAERRSARLLNG